jgi:hypothetical protein
MTVKTKSGSFTLHETVRLAASCADFAPGTKGTIVEVYPGGESYAVELFDDEGETLDVVDCASAVLKARG